MFWHWLTILVENFLFHENLGEVFSDPRKEYQMTCKFQKTNKQKSKKSNWEPTTTGLSAKTRKDDRVCCFSRSKF